jgi:hypothetical protein
MTTYNHIIVCQGCGRTKRLKGRGLCAGCYWNRVEKPSRAARLQNPSHSFPDALRNKLISVLNRWDNPADRARRLARYEKQALAAKPLFEEELGRETA